MANRRSRPVSTDQRAIERALTLAIAPVPSAQPVISRQDPLEERGVTTPTATEAPRLARGESATLRTRLPQHGHPVAGIARSNDASHVDGEPFQARLETDEFGRVLLYEGLWAMQLSTG
jgi:hypothetical protein